MPDAFCKESLCSCFYGTLLNLRPPGESIGSTNVAINKANIAFANIRIYFHISGYILNGINADYVKHPAFLDFALVTSQAAIVIVVYLAGHADD